MVGAALALGSSLGYGIGDFLGGATSRHIGPLRFLFCAQLIGVVLAGGWVVFSSDPVPPFGAIAAAGGAGLGLTVGLAAFFQAMAVGKMSVVAPINATGAVLPVAVGLITGEQPSGWQIIGILSAVAGVVLVAQNPGDRQA